MKHLQKEVAESFYSAHRGKPFYQGLVEFMTEGPCIIAVLEKENAITAYRELMGPTDPTKAGDGSIRKVYGADVRRNAVHGSDSPENARKEIGFFFSDSELIDEK